jgi:hypothetical protein
VSSVEDAAVAAVMKLADSCAAILPTSLVAAILHGSLTGDDFQPARSDLDLLLVVERSLTPIEADALVEVARAADLGPAGGLDLLVVSRRTAENPADFPCRELLVGRWPGPSEDLEIEARDVHVPDLWPELSEARAHGRSLLGPEPQELIGQVSRDLVLTNGVGWIRRWLGLIEDAKNASLMVLTACRVWHFEVTGEHASKTYAGQWALERDPSLTAVAQALSTRVAPDASTIPPHEVERVLLRVLRDLAEDPPA